MQTEHPAASTHAKVPVGCFLNFPVNSKNIRAGSHCGGGGIMSLKRPAAGGES